ncbi:MAG TPA: NAD(P)/FAD-dependent oxidoreductase [Ktedonobacterales bacterium]|nr:NAD(P)/FAD-dependent oxidoreductase [Ktedonobacterales bacterium]
MSSQYSAYDAVIVGAGPNGLAAAITLARAGHSVIIYEASDVIGGGSRSKELTLPGFVHDVCSAIHPLAVGSPFFRTLPLEQYGVEWIHPDAPLAHPLLDGSAALLERSFEATGATLGPDAAAWRRLFGPLVRRWDSLAEGILAPLRPLWQAGHPITSLAMAQFGFNAVQSARGLAERSFKGEHARAMFMGMAAHSMLPMEQPVSAAAGLVLGGLGHAVGWPLPRGGSQRIVDALAAYLRDLGGEIVTGAEIRSLAELPPSRAVLCDVTPRQLLALTGDTLPEGYQRQMQRYRYGPGVFKIDLALDGPIPWRAEACLRAGTVHVGGAPDEIAAGERSIWRGVLPDLPYVLLAQQSLFDDSRAPAGKHTAWAYCHVPNGCTVDMTERIEAQIERFAPGFRDRILARHTYNPAELESYNANYIGGDINGGVQDLRQLFTRPSVRIDPYSTPISGLYICSSSTPPGGGVHGLCGYFAAQSALGMLGESSGSVQARVVGAPDFPDLPNATAAGTAS